MRIALLADYYVDYLSAFERANAARTADLNFAGHQELLFADYFGSFISYRNHFRRLGHTAELFVANYYLLQQKWATEHGLRIVAGRTTKHELALEQLREFGPDLVFVGSMFDYYGAFFKAVSEITKNIFTWISCPIPTGLDFSHIRCVLSSIPEYVQNFRKCGVNSELLRAAFDPDVLPELGETRRDLPVSFAGALTRGSHESRLATLEYLIREGVPVQIWGTYSYSGKWAAFKSLFSGSKVRRHVQPALWGLEMYRTLARSRITLNAHIDVAKKNQMAGNMRLYEATGCGSLLITDDAPGLQALFQPDVELVTYRSNRELATKTRRYLEEPERAAQIAQAGQHACLERHSYSHRIREFEQIIQQHC
jgi:spore maturation protein CgeB